MKKLFIFILLFLTLIPNCLASSVVMDMDNKRVLSSSNMNEVRLIASTTKIMTAILAIESNKLENIVTVGKEVLKMYGSNIYISLNEQILLLDLVYGLMLRSGNDAAIVIANNVSKDEEAFVKLMNEKAKELGMVNTIYNNPHGLDEETKNYSTAYDLCLLYSYAYQNPIFRQVVGTKYYKTTSSLKSYSFKNRNNLLFSYKNATGGKTGYTPLAGRILVTSASKNDINLCIATLDSSSYLYDFHQNSYDEMFNKLKKYQILDKDNLKIMGIDNDLYLKKDFYYTLTEEEYQNIEVKTNITKTSYKDNDIIGDIYVYFNNEVIEKQPIYVKVVKEKEFFLTRILKKLLSF